MPPLCSSLPVLSLLYARNDRGGGEYAVLRCVPLHHLLGFLGCRSFFGQTQPVLITRRTHAAPPLIRNGSISSSPARVQPSSATRKATGSFTPLASCIRSFDSSWTDLAQINLAPPLRRSRIRRRASLSERGHSYINHAPIQHATLRSAYRAKVPGQPEQGALHFVRPELIASVIELVAQLPGLRTQPQGAGLAS